MNFVTSQSITAAMTRPGPSLPACQSPQSAVRPGTSQARAQNSSAGATGGSPGVAEVSDHDEARHRRSGDTVEEHVARARQKPAVAKLYAFYAAGAGFRDGRPAEHCPFDQPGEDALRETWFWFYSIQAAAARKARPATPPAEFRKAPRRIHHSKRVVTTSAAYAEQLGVEPVTEEGEQ